MHDEWKSFPIDRDMALLATPTNLLGVLGPLSGLAFLLSIYEILQRDAIEFRAWNR